jgi:hypothetical protein
VVKLLTHALRLHGQRVSARVTGQRPQESLQGKHLPDPTPWRPSPRPGIADPDELRRWLAEVVRRVEPDAVVIENPAFTPESMRAVNEHIALPTLALLTDCVADHLDVWPDDPLAIARLHVRSIPRGVPILTRDPIIRNVARAEGCDMFGGSEFTAAESLPQWMRDHCTLVWSALTALISPIDEAHWEALATLATSLLPRALRLDGGAHFVDLFDANDPVTAAAALSSLRFPTVSQRIGLYAHRRDRPWRWRVFRPWLERAFDEVVRVTSDSNETLITRLRSLGESSLIVGVGNAAGPAEALRSRLTTGEENFGIHH